MKIQPHLEARPTRCLSREVRTLVDMVRGPSTDCPDSIALGFVDHQGRSDDLTYEELYHGSLAIAAWMAARGVSRGDRVLLVHPEGRDFVLCFFGAVLAGAVPVPFAPPFGLAKIFAYQTSFAALARDCGARCCLTNSRLAAVLSDAVRDLPGRFDVVSLHPADCRPAAGFTPVEASAADLAFLQYTSGSTSQPKGVMLTHGNLLANIAAFTGAARVDSRDVLVSWLPLFHDMGLIGMLMGALYARVRAYLMAPELFIRSPKLWLGSITRRSATLTCAPNFAFHYCVKHIDDASLGEFDLGTLRAMLNGAEPIDLDAVNSFERKFAAAGLRKNVIMPVYGLAESSLAVSFPEPGEVVTETVDVDHLEHSGEIRAPEDNARRKTLVSVGTPIATQQIQIWDDAHRPLRERRVGEIVVKGPSVMQGYYNNCEATAAALTDGWLRTGDYGYVSRGNLYITGRKKDLIIRRGRNYFPQDIEQTTGGVPGVRKGRVVAFAIEVEGRDAEVVIVAESRVTGAARRDELARAIKQAVGSQFPFSPIDVKIVGPGGIPRTSSGKIRRQPCKDHYLRGTLGHERERRLVVALWALKAAGVHAWHVARRALSGVGHHRPQRSVGGGVPAEGKPVS